MAVPSYAMEDGEMGNENVGAEDQAVPRISLLQSLSPVVVEQSVPGAMPGLLFNTVSEELFKTLYVVNLFYLKQYGVFKKKKMGGGFVGNFATEALGVAHLEAEDLNLGDYDILETGRHTVLILDEKGEILTPAEILMKSTNLSISRKWNSNIRTEGGGASRFALVWELSSKLRKGDGFTWHVFDVALAGATPEHVYAEAKEFYESLQATKQ
jgi:hypothetical protein